MDQDQIVEVAGVIGSLEYQGIVKFDEQEPEYKALSIISRELGTDSHRALLGICAGAADYQLAGDTQLFWNELEQAALAHGQLDSTSDEGLRYHSSDREWLLS
jgi:N-glycosylase/DNA lyase